jgi:hypothetical protein
MDFLQTTAIYIISCFSFCRLVSCLLVYAGATRSSASVYLVPKICYHSLNCEIIVISDFFYTVFCNICGLEFGEVAENSVATRS